MNREEGRVSSWAVFSLTGREYDALLERQGGTCCGRGCTASEALIAEHATPSAWRRAKPDQQRSRNTSGASATARN